MSSVSQLAANDLQQLATDIVTKAVKAGASDAEVTIREGDEFSTTVRMGEVETLKESGSRGMGLRVLIATPNGHRVASTSSSDFYARRHGTPRQRRACPGASDL